MSPHSRAREQLTFALKATKLGQTCRFAGLQVCRFAGLQVCSPEIEPWPRVFTFTMALPRQSRGALFLIRLDGFQGCLLLLPALTGHLCLPLPLPLPLPLAVRIASATQAPLERHASATAQQNTLLGALCVLSSPLGMGLEGGNNPRRKSVWCNRLSSLPVRSSKRYSAEPARYRETTLEARSITP